MRENKKYAGQLVFGLDIGTRSIVGTVGYKKGNQFIVIAQRSREHETRAMLDGQIHDIGQVGETIEEIKELLEEATGRTLSEVCIAAAGRVLRTVTTHVEYPFHSDQEITQEDIYSLVSAGIEKAYQEFLEKREEDEAREMKFYCVGHSVVRYYLNGYPMGNLEGHKARVIGLDLIATFLPDDVVDGLYRAVELAGLKVSNLTLEPIAAIGLAIPERFRMLNIALLDIGAGTSDISITNDGCIIAYGMIPIAGDALTEEIARHCLVDFDMAEHIKRQAGEKEIIEYTDILLLPQTITASEVSDITSHIIEDMATQAADKIIELNGGKAVSAVFVVGGGGKMPGYTDAIADRLGIARERVALRGEEVMQQIVFQEDIKKDSLLVTPIGICLNFYEQSNNFIFVSFNGKRIKIYDNNNLTVADAAMQAQFPNDGLFPKRGKELNFTLNGKQRIVRGLPGEAAVITVNGEITDINGTIHANDIVQVQESTAGDPAVLTIGELPEATQSLVVFVNEKKVEVPRFSKVNGELKSNFYEIGEGDAVEILNYYTVGQIIEFMDVVLEPRTNLYVNNKLADRDTPVYENFSVTWTLEEIVPYSLQEPLEKTGEAWQESSDENGEDWQDSSEEDGEDWQRYSEEDGEDWSEKSEQEYIDQSDGHDVPRPARMREETVTEPHSIPVTITVTVNGAPVHLSGKSEYVYVDVFDHIDFDLSIPRGKSLVTNLNARAAEYLEPLHSGDVLEIYWKE